MNITLIRHYESECAKRARERERAKQVFVFAMFGEISRQGYLSQYSSVGCYTILYLTAHGEPMCAECAETALLYEEEDPDLRPIARDVYWEGPDLECVSCEKRIESSYGDPEVDE